MALSTTEILTAQLAILREVRLRARRHAVAAKQAFDAVKLEERKTLTQEQQDAAEIFTARAQGALDEAVRNKIAAEKHYRAHNYKIIESRSALA